MTLGNIHFWLLHARPGQRYAYHRGDLAVDRDPEHPEIKRDLVARERAAQVHETANTVAEAAACGKVALFRKRVGPGAFEYFAVKL